MTTETKKAETAEAPFGAKPRLGVRLARGLAEALFRARLRPFRLSVDALLRAAKRRTGLDDFGDKDFLEPLELLVQSYDSDPNLNGLGRLVFRQTCIRLLMNRLRIARTLADRPELRQVPIRSPWFVLGLPRTGTTLLHKILAQDPGFRTLPLWQVAFPAPADDSPANVEKRRRATERQLSLIRYFVPTAAAIHDLQVDAPEECLHLFYNAFVCAIFSPPIEIPRYQEWYSRADMSGAYRYYRTQLQILLGTQETRQLLLKWPLHMDHLGVLSNEFPDACIIQTHRNPTQVVPSFCSLIAEGQRPFVYQVDHARIGRHSLEMLAERIHRMLAFRQQHPDVGVCNIAYDDLVINPLGCVERIYDYFGRPLTAEVKARMQQWLAEHPQNKHGRHRYSLEQFGLERANVERTFQSYCEHYKLGSAAPAMSQT